MSPQSVARGKVLVGVGANYPGPWGEPANTLRRALSELERRGVTVLAVSDLYETAAMGQPRQPPYLNAVALLSTSLPASALLRLLKQIEARAGRRGGRPWGERTLDLDILDYKGLKLNWARARWGRPRQRAHPLILPHPELDQRAFVLRPLLDVAPNWRHPVLKVSARELWHRVSKRRQGRVLRRLS
ncbi:MAG: 2-amino-4-hydroxy-6-hydroxymethyldihydropteridine diphosphokinase [Methyloceanibacter sp.]